METNNNNSKLMPPIYKINNNYCTVIQNYNEASISINYDTDFKYGTKINYSEFLWLLHNKDKLLRDLDYVENIILQEKLNEKEN